MNENLDELIATMQEIWRFVNQNNKPHWAQKHGTILQFFALRFLIDNPNSTLTDVTEHLRITKSSATQLVDRLNKQRLVKKTSDKKDKRIIHLKSTDKGVREINKARKKRMEGMRRIFSKVPQKDIKGLLRIEKSLLKTLKEDKI